MTSYLIIPATIVLKLCATKLYKIEEARAKHWATLTAREIAAHDRWRYFFPWLKALDEEKARERITERPISDIALLVLLATEESAVRELQSLANRHPEGAIYLSPEDNKNLQ